MAIGEIMLLLWITSLLAGVAVQVQMAEEPLPAMKDSPPPSQKFDHAIVVGPGRSVRLDGKHMETEEVIAALGKERTSKVELRAAHDVDAALFFACRYRLREAGIGYVERPPFTAGKNNNTKTGGLRK